VGIIIMTLIMFPLFLSKVSPDTITGIITAVFTKKIEETLLMS
jgi:hypothetical protein